LNESVENSQRASGVARMARNAINDSANLKLAWKERLNQWKAFCHQMVTPPCTTHPLLHANWAQIARQLQCDFCNFELRSRILGFLWRVHAVIARDCVHVRLNSLECPFPTTPAQLSNSDTWVFGATMQFG
jgi:hypothetical protein